MIVAGGDLCIRVMLTEATSRCAGDDLAKRVWLRSLGARDWLLATMDGTSDVAEALFSSTNLPA